MNAHTENNGRNYGIDALRVLSMLMIVVMHILGKGGVLGAAPRLGANFLAAALLETVAFPAVNCYALISGYVGAGGRTRFSRLALLWAQVALYAFVIETVFFITVPGAVSVRALLATLFPAVSGQYWYFSAYFALFLCMPLLNAGMERTPRRILACALGVGFIAFCCLPTLFGLDGFRLQSGYTPLWLIYLYALGGYIRRFNPLARVSASKLALACAAALIASWLSIPAIGMVTLRRSGEASHLTYLLKFNSPLMVIASVCMLELCLRARIPEGTKRIIAVLAPLSFSVYLIHTHPLVFERLIGGRFAVLAAHPMPLMVLEILLAALCVFASCSAIDAVRLRLFNALRLRERLEKRIDDRLSNT